MIPRSDTRALDVELAYTPHAAACRDPYSASVWCRRPDGHDGDHAAGHGEHRTRWPLEVST